MTVIHDWDEAGYLASLRDSLETAEKEAAEEIEKRARKYLSAAKGHGDSAPKLEGALKVAKSEYENGGYVVGVFDSSPPAKWEDSVGARAIYYEFGHAAPYTRAANKGHKKRTVEELVTTPKPFLLEDLKNVSRSFKRKVDEVLS